MLIKQVFGSFWAISGLTKEIYNLHLSLFNWGAINNPNLLEIGNDFKYFLVRYDDYLKFRTMAFASNWQNYWIKTKNGKMIYKLAKLKAQREFDLIKEEIFLNHSHYSEYLYRINQ